MQVCTRALLRGSLVLVVAVAMLSQAQAKSAFATAEEVEGAPQGAFLLAQVSPVLRGLTVELVRIPDASPTQPGTLTAPPGGTLLAGPLDTRKDKDRPKPIRLAPRRGRLPDNWTSPCQHDQIMFGLKRETAVLLAGVEPGRYSISVIDDSRGESVVPLLKTEYTDSEGKKAVASVPYVVVLEPGRVTYAGSFLFEDMGENYFRFVLADNLPTVLSVLDQWETGLANVVQTRITKASFLTGHETERLGHSGMPEKPWLKPLHDAAAKGDVSAITALLDQGADANAADRYGRTPLHMAAEGGSTEAVRLLLSRGADCNKTDTPTRWMASSYLGTWGFATTDLVWQYVSQLAGDNKITIVQLLSGSLLVMWEKSDVALTLERVGPDEDGVEGGTPLHRAADKGHIEVVRLMLEAGAVVDAPDGDGETPLLRALTQGHGAVADLLANHGSREDMRDMMGRSLLHAASAGGVDAWVDQLLTRGADANVRDGFGDTPLHLAAAHGRLIAAQRLLGAGATVDAVGRYERTPLHGAAENGQRAVAELLLTGGAKVGAKDNSGNTPLHLAAAEGHAAVVQLLLARGADPNDKDQQGRTPLQRAEQKKRPDVIEVLKKRVGGR